MFIPRDKLPRKTRDYSSIIVNAIIDFDSKEFCQNSHNEQCFIWMYIDKLNMLINIF